MTTPVVAAGIYTAFGAYIERVEIPQLLHFFSDEFGHHNRMEYLNYIRVKDKEPDTLPSSGLHT